MPLGFFGGDQRISRKLAPAALTEGGDRCSGAVSKVRTCTPCPTPHPPTRDIRQFWDISEKVTLGSYQQLVNKPKYPVKRCTEHAPSTRKQTSTMTSMSSNHTRDPHTANLLLSLCHTAVQISRSFKNLLHINDRVCIIITCSSSK